MPVAHLVCRVSHRVATCMRGERACTRAACALARMHALVLAPYGQPLTQSPSTNPAQPTVHGVPARPPQRDDRACMHNGLGARVGGAARMLHGCTALPAGSEQQQQQQQQQQQRMKRARMCLLPPACSAPRTRSHAADKAVVVAGAEHAHFSQDAAGPTVFNSTEEEQIGDTGRVGNCCSLMGRLRCSSGLQGRGCQSSGWRGACLQPRPVT